MAGYKYEERKGVVLTDDGQRLFLQIRDRAQRLLKEAGAFRLLEVTKGFTGDSWNMMASVDRLVELGEIVELTDPSKVYGQDRIFRSTKR